MMNWEIHIKEKNLYLYEIAQLNEKYKKKQIPNLNIK